MSTTHSPFSPHKDVAGFKNHAHSDALLPSSPEEEQLTPIPASRTTPRSNASALDTPSPYQQATSPYSTGTPGFNEEEQRGLQFTGMNEFEAPDFSNNYLMEAKFGEFSNEIGDTTYFREQHLVQQEEPLSATSTTSRSANTISRKSTGLATMSSSQLMSPQLTDAASPSSGFDSSSPTIQHRLLGGGDLSSVPSDATAADVSHLAAMQTPAATGSSVDASPNLDQNLDQSQGRFPAPRVQVESYSRGDSPARTGSTLNELITKKRRGSHSSSHLAAPALDSSEDGEYEEEQPVDLPGGTYGSRYGLDPSQRRQIEGEAVMSLKDQQQEAELQAKNAEVSQWLSDSEAVAPTNARPPPSASLSVQKPTASRRRAKSIGNRPELQADAFSLSRGIRAAQNASIPGPGLLVNEDSEADDEDEDSAMYAEEAPASIDGREHQNEARDYFPDFLAHDERPQDAYPWIDPIYFPSQEGTVGQPGTSNEAMMRFAKRAQDLETVSRAATWGTSPRRLSDSDLQRVFGAGGLFSRLSVSRHADREEWRQLKESVESRVLNFLPKRSNSSSKRKQSEPTRPSSKENSPTESGRKESTHRRKESLQSLHERKESLSASFRRLPSVKRPRSPKLNTSGAGFTPSNAQARGQSATSPTEGHSPTHKHGVFRHAREMLSRHSSRDASEPHLATLWTQSGGPPLPNIASPPSTKEEAVEAVADKAQDADGDSDEGTEERGIQMDLAPRQDMIIPTFDGFKINIREINPRLPVYLVERLGQEQLRRYKKLVEFKVKHAQAIHDGNCDSGAQCIEKGGVPIYFPAKATQKEPALSHTGFTAAGTGEAEDDEDVAPDGQVTEAQFPQGVPMPPVKRLPAKFECPLCFSVKKFTKPSDWSKHVHEDLQPFTCTFPTCPDPKSFKRKADWVRHENERHRQLEWWQCTEDGCAHQCYRRDNFVQHLVREHKMPEPKAKTVKPDNKPAVRGPAKSKGRGNKDFSPEDKVLMMVEKCRRETTKNPMDEPCKFCGNVCNTFKKLTVHLARHMEQISMPVLELVKEKAVSPDTIISPIEAKLAQTSLSPSTHSPYVDSASVSPFDQPLAASTTMQELPGAFAPMPVGTSFQQPQYNHMVTWNHSPGVNATMAPQNTTVYDGGLAGPWMHANGPYTNGQGSGYPSVVEMPSGNFSEQPAAAPSDSFHRLQSSMHQGMTMPYQDGRDYPVTLNQTSQFHVPHYVGDSGNMAAETNQNGMQLQYGSKEHGSYSRSGGDQAIYSVQAQVHPSSQQQQYYGSY